MRREPLLAWLFDWVVNSVSEVGSFVCWRAAGRAAGSGDRAELGGVRRPAPNRVGRPVPDARWRAPRGMGSRALGRESVLFRVQGPPRLRRVAAQLNPPVPETREVSAAVGAHRPAMGAVRRRWEQNSALYPMGSWLRGGGLRCCGAGGSCVPHGSGPSLAGMLTQDEFSHDILVEYPGGLWLVYDST